MRSDHIYNYNGYSYQDRNPGERSRGSSISGILRDHSTNHGFHRNHRQFYLCSGRSNSQPIITSVASMGNVICVPVGQLSTNHSFHWHHRNIIYQPTIACVRTIGVLKVYLYQKPILKNRRKQVPPMLSLPWLDDLNTSKELHDSDGTSVRPH